MKEASLSIESELRMPIEPLVSVLVVSGFVLVFLCDNQPDPSVKSILVLCAMLFFALGATAWWLDGTKPAFGRWGTVLALVAMIYLTSHSLDKPEILVLVVIPTTLAVPLISLRASSVIALIETLLLFSIPHIVNPRADGVIPGIMLASLWGTLGIIYAVYRPAHQISERSWQYLERARALKAETYNRKAALAQALDDLTHANRELTLANERLAALRTIAEEAQKTKVAFVAKVSHEFRTPLNMIIGLVGLLVESPELYGETIPSAVLEDLRIVYRNCDHLSSLVDDVLALSQAEAGRLTVYRERTDLSEIVDRALAIVQPLVDKKGLSLEISIQDNLPLVYCDRTRIRQVILNLVSNAARFTEQGQIRVDVAQHDQNVIVSVMDTGPGIPPQETERIFEPFCQGADRLWRDKGGIGLGLTISKQLVELHGGQIWLDSKLGFGTTFSFKLPISPPIAHIARPGHQINEEWIWRKRMSYAHLPDSHYRPRIVLCDYTGDLYPVLRQYSDQVELIGTRDVLEAIRELERCPAHALIVNARSPDDLWVSIERIRQEIPKMPIIACAVPPKLERALKAHASDYLTKPVSRKDLQSAIEAVGKPVKRVLVVDDDPSVLGLWSRMLDAMGAGLEVVQASSGMEALDALYHNRPDMVMLDVIMPHFDGWEVLKQKYQDEAIRDIPVILVSARDPMDLPFSSQALLVSIGDGIPLGKLMACSLRISELLLNPDQELVPMRE